MPIPKNVLINFLGGAWGGLLIVLTTPVFVARLGLGGFGLVGFWQLLIYLSMVLDFGMGAACSRELARSQGVNAEPARFRAVFRLFERPVLGIAVLMAIAIFAAGETVAVSWLRVASYSSEDVALAVRLMSLSIAGQFLTGFYANSLAGLQRMGEMNALQALNNGLRYLGGALVVTVTPDITVLFAFQAVACLVSAGLSRAVVARALGPAARTLIDVGSLRQFMRFSGGMFVTAVCGALLSNADRLAVSKLLDGEALGKYSVALTAIGLLQMFVFAFHRAYYPRFAQLNAGGDQARLKSVYYDACALVGTVLVPTSLVFLFFTPQLFMLWLGWSDPATVWVSRSLVVGFVLSGVMWLPAAYQQAVGWTRLHASLMALTLAIGVPLLIWAILRWGLAGAPILMVTHGLVQITAALWLMNRVLFPGESLLWYRKVLVRPLLTAGPLVVLSAMLLPGGLGRLALAAWLGATLALSAAGTLAWTRWVSPRLSLR